MAAEPPVQQYDRDYTVALGRLFAGFGTLELTLRIALYLMDTRREHRRPPDWRIAALAVGETIEKSWLSSWSFLSQLIDAYNERHARLDLPLIDAGIVDLRNAMAHGSISAIDERRPFVVVKFAPPKDGNVTVEARYELTLEWLGEQTRRVQAAIQQVARRVEERG